MHDRQSLQPDWVLRGKTIRQLIEELQSFENQDLPVEISVDGGATRKPISLVKKAGQVCLLVNSEI
jgi:pentose-5-phosphate-3-epimerase